MSGQPPARLRPRKGLRAKARAVAVALDDSSADCFVFDDEALSLCRSLAADVERMMREIADHEGGANAVIQATG